MKRIILLLTVFLPIRIFSPGLDKDTWRDFRERQFNIYLEQIYDKELTRFACHLGMKESGNRWTAVNPYGYFGEYQFGKSALKRLGYEHITVEKFKADSSIFPPELQMEVLKQLIRINSMDLRPFSGYINTEIKGIRITKSGLLAGMHLGGLGAVQLFLESGGCVDKADTNGTRISHYIKEFSLYNL